MNEFGFSQEMEKNAREKKLQGGENLPEIEGTHEGSNSTETEAEVKSPQEKKTD